jgi:hypothetical protein
MLSSLVSTAAVQAYIYWGQEQPYGQGVGRAGLDGSGADNGYIPGPGGTYAFTRGVAADGTDVYWGNNNPHSTTGFAPPVIGRRDLAASSDNQAFTAVTGQTITSLALAGGYLYYTSNNQDTSEVGRTPAIGGQQFQSITSIFGEPNPHTCGVTADEKYVYWANRTTNSIGRAELANFGTAGQVVEGDWLPLPDPPGITSLPCGVAVDGTYVYWGIDNFVSSGTLQPGTTIGRAKKADGSEATNAFLGGGNEVTGLTIAGDFLYWSNLGGYVPGGGSIGRGNVSGSGWDGTFVSGLTAPYGVAVDSAGPAPAPASSPGPGFTPPTPLPVFKPGSGGEPVPTPKRPDFSHVWTKAPVFVPARWSTPVYAATSAQGPPEGTVFNFILNRAAKVTVAIQAKGGGKALFTLTRKAHKGLNHMPFSGRFKGKAMAPGSYRAVFTAHAGKTVSKPGVFAFRIANG